MENEFAYFFGPEFPVFKDILQVVSYDVGFLEKETHRIWQRRVLTDQRIF